MEKLLQVNELETQFTKDKEKLKILRGVSFHINKGEVLGLVGESGCGKSLTSLSIMKLFKGTSGEISGGSISFKGEDLTHKSEREMRKIRGKQMAMIFQEPMTSLNPVMKIGEQLLEPIRLHLALNEKQAKEHVIFILKKVGIPRAEEIVYEFPHQLSGGMRQRIMIAMAMSCNPQLLIADEPTTALDVTIQAQILELMKQLQREEGMSVLLITHDLGVVAEMCDRVAVMYAGRVVEEANVFDLFESPKHPYTKGLIGSVPKIGQRKDKLTSIKGNVPDPSNMPKGCKFAPRCTEAMAICLEEEPNATDLGNGRMCSCWMIEEGRKNVYA
ncbi:ABC transporter ATP-binding protein [Cytobacillus oceanisediminis]|uniref:ABC transporter ATP-binding protein n=1 Tax=Cytobacillus oceanisediminis TaxID=665099 RepID=UPI00203DA5E1|nr:ABC transporter ATP-binding protein [Cytobacillus oceanisediminis]MBY0155496.1 ABC transporter ATP-binding protein [Cytobacillus firmus]MCM3401192.1 ABC transporter ATP-binding protein [Cytobacillus oceanisediminis]MCM3530292.1 ABC transporter ATP-binding protein [Cytobacillus oceanisediminis]USK42390.1 ABC transporter ATP-binding protein [Cytobacillus oceanisediminis]